MAKYSPMTTDLQDLAEVGRRRQARRFSIVVASLAVGVVLLSVVVADPTTRVGAVVLAIVLLSTLLGMLLAYRMFFRTPGPELAFVGLPTRERKDLLKRLMRGDAVEDEELQVADGLLTAARRPALPVIFALNLAVQVAYLFGDNVTLHVFTSLAGGLALVSILIRRNQLARRTDVVDRAAAQRRQAG